MKNLAFALLIALSVSIGKAQQESLCDPKIYTFHYDVPGTPNKKVNTLARLGLDGMIFQVKNNTINEIDKYKNANKVANGKFNIYSIYYTLNLNNSVNYNKITNIYNKLQGTDILLQIIFTGTPSQAYLEQTVSQIADIAASKGKEVVIYPHDNTRILSVDEAITVIEAVNKPNIFLAVHLAHVLRAGNGNNVTEVVNNAAPYLKIATISGATLSEIGSGTNWDDVVKPIGEGTYDIVPFYNALHQVGFKGPIGIHTFGLLQNFNLTVQQHVPPAIEIINGYGDLICNTSEINDINDLAVSNLACDELTLTWSDAGAEDAYRIRRKPPGGAYTVLGDVPANTLNYVDATVSESTSYVYMVRPMLNDSAVAVSNTPEITTPACTTQTGSVYFIDHNSSGKRLKANSSGGAVGVKAATATGSQVQWEEVDAGGGYFYLVHLGSGRKLNASNNGDVINTLAATNTGNSTQWRWIDAGGGWNRLENRQFTEWLHIKPDGTSDFMLGPTSWMGNNTKWKYTAVPGLKSISLQQSKSNNLTLFPNPASETIKISGLTPQKEVQVFDLSGSLMIQSRNSEIDISNLKKGMYFVRIDGFNTIKFVVE